jgi:hypothetical protein
MNQNRSIERKNLEKSHHCIGIVMSAQSVVLGYFIMKGERQAEIGKISKTA